MKGLPDPARYSLKHNFNKIGAAFKKIRGHPRRPLAAFYAPGLASQLFGQQLIDQRGVGLAAGRAHDLAHKEAD